MPPKGSPIVAFLELIGYETECVAKKNTAQGIVLAWRDSLTLQQVRLLELDSCFGPAASRKKQGNNALMAIFSTAKGSSLAVATTHLHWNPKEEEVKYLELAGLLQAFEQFSQEVPAKLLCGDLNSLPFSNTINLLRGVEPALDNIEPAFRHKVDFKLITRLWADIKEKPVW